MTPADRGSSKIAVEAEQDRADFRRQHLEPRLQQLDRVRACLAQALPMRDELRGLPREQEILRGLIAPGPYRFQRGRAVERAVDFGGRKLGRVPGEPIPFPQIPGIEPLAPAIIGPPRGTDENLAHAVTSWRRPESAC